MKNTWRTLCLVGVIILALALRSYNLEGRTTFEWDQERDRLAVEKMLTTKRPLLTGPIVQGEGGFLLGPLYYYVIFPAYLIMHGSILAAATTTVFLDVITVLMIFLATRELYDDKTALIASGLWAASNAAIQAARIPWNVSLIPIYTATAIWLMHKRQTSSQNIYRYLIAAWWMLSLHIHPTTILVVPALLIAARKKPQVVSGQVKRNAVIAGLVPLVPLIIFDLRHALVNTKLMMRFVGKTDADPTLDVARAIIEKLGGVFTSIFIGGEYLRAGILLAALTLVILRKNKTWLNNGVLVLMLALIVALFLRKDAQFATYYVTPLLVPLTISIARSASRMPRWLGVAFVAAIIGNNVLLYSFQDTLFNPKAKRQIIESIADWNKTVDLRLMLPEGRRSGFDYYIRQNGLTIDDTSSNVALVVERSQQEIIAPEKARSIVKQVTRAGFTFVGFSN